MRKDLYTNGSVDLPKINKGRSFFDLSHSSHLDMNAGLLYPIDQVIEIIPGDTFDYSHRLNIRMTNPPKTPTMDQLVLDLFWFYCPTRICDKNFDNFITNNSGSYYVDYTGNLSYINIVSSSWSSSTYCPLEYSVLDFLGYGTLNFMGSGINARYNPLAAPVVGFYKIWNEYFRYQPLQNEILVLDAGGLVHNANTTALPISKTSYYDAALSTNNYSDYLSLMQKTFFALVLPPVNRLPGYFSKSLPYPVSHDDVKIFDNIEVAGTGTGDKLVFNWDSNPSSSDMLYVDQTSGAKGTIYSSLGANITGFSGKLVSSSNTIQALSNAFALNKFLYIDNLYGKRITDWTYGHFGVQVPDSRVQRPEFLAKKRVYININQIMQSSETGTSPQGNAGAWSQTFDKAHDFTKSFTEFGYLYSLGCIRVLNHTFAQGVDKHWLYRTRFDYYLPEFNNVGDQPVMKYEIYGDTLGPDGVFGYQERFAHLKMLPSRVAGKMRPTATNPLSIWTYTDYYSTGASLTATWVMEPRNNIDNTMYIASSVAPSFILDYVADIKSYRSMPYHSVPGGLTGSW